MPEVWLVQMAEVCTLCIRERQRERARARERVWLLLMAEVCAFRCMCITGSVSIYGDDDEFTSLRKTLSVFRRSLEHFSRVQKP